MAGPDMRLSLYHDDTERLSFDDVQNAAFLPTTRKYLNSNLAASNYWVRVDIDGMKSSDLILSSCYMQLDFITVMVHEADGWQEYRSGDQLPFSNQAVQHHCFAFDLNNSDKDTVYVRVQGKGLVKLPLKIDSQVDFWRDAQSKQLWHGFAFAFLAAMFFYNLFLFFMIREKGYLYYVGYLGSVTLFMMTISGHAPMYLWPDSPRWADFSSIYLCTLALFFGLQFLRDMTNIDKIKPAVGRAMIVVGVLGFSIFFFYQLQPRIAFYALGIYIFAVFVLITTAIIISLRNRWAPTYFLLLSPLLMIPAVLIYYARFIGWIENSWLTEHLLELTTIAESMLLSFALAYRIRLMSSQIAEHQQQENQAQRQLSQSLLKAADQERRSIARELHDNFGQGLLVIKNLANKVQSNTNKEQIKNQLRTLIADTRSMARSMHPQQIENLGFVTALETMLFDTIATAGIELTLDFEPLGKRLNGDAELHLYRIMQESATNIIKHAKADQVDASLHVSDSKLTLMIADNGIGMPENIKSGLGSLNMRERAAIIHATIRVDTVQPHGTSITITLDL